MENLSLFKNSRSGVWFIQYRTPDGIRKQRSTRCTHKSDAMKVLSDFKKFLEEDTRSKRQMVLSSFSKDFIEYAKVNYSIHTTYMYEKTLDHFKRICGDLPLTKFSAKHYDLFKVTRLKDHVQGKIRKDAPKRSLSPITVNIELRALRSAFNTALRWQLLTKSPFQGMGQIPIPKKTPAFLTAEDVNALIKATTRQWLQDIIIFAVNTGMRRGELLSLRWCDINTEKRIAKISNREDFTSKSGEERVVVLNDAALAVVKRCQRSDKHEYLFSREEGVRVLPDWLTAAFKDAARKAGLPEGIHLHSTRHSFASLLVGSGTSLFTVSKLLGHSDTKTSEIYSHLLPQHLHSEVDKINIDKVNSSTQN
jgi:integrase